jgi:hypothetical protein
MTKIFIMNIFKFKFYTINNIYNKYIYKCNYNYAKRKKKQIAKFILIDFPHFFGVPIA